MKLQVYSTASGNPTFDGIKPNNPQLPAFYFTAGSVGIDVLWGWDVPAQNWKQYTPSQQIYIGAIIAPATAPSTSPLNPLIPAFFKDLTSGVIFTWNPATNTWI